MSDMTDMQETSSSEITEDIEPTEESFIEITSDTPGPSSSKETPDDNNNVTEKGKGKAISKRIYKCDQCPFRSKFAFSLRRHRETRHKGNRFSCKCGKKFSDKWELRYHEQALCGSELICDKCGNKFSTRQGLYNHDLSVHKKTFPHNCTICNFGCLSSNQFIGHMKKHMKVKQTCKQCGSAFTYPADYSVHIKSCKENSSLTCETCNMKFTTKKTLKTHCQGLHAGEERFRCERCNKGFRWSSSLSYHRKSGKCF